MVDRAVLFSATMARHIIARTVSTSGGLALGAVLALGCGDERGVKSLDEAFSFGGESAFTGEGSRDSEQTGTASSSRTCGVSTEGLVAYLPFDGDTRVLGGRGLYSESADASFGPGVRGEALHLDYGVRIRSSSSLTLSSWTTCAWLNRSIMEEDLVVLAAQSGTVLGVTGEYGMCDSAPGHLFYLEGGDRFDCSASDRGRAYTEQWSFACWAYDSNRGTLLQFVDGSASTSSYVGDALHLSSSAQLVIGARGTSEDRLDELSLWGRALSASEMARLSETESCALVGPGDSDVDDDMDW
jgi:hypothetical protein